MDCHFQHDVEKTLEKLMNKELERVTKFKYLGSTVDQNRNGGINQHEMEKLQKKCSVSS